MCGIAGLVGLGAAGHADRVVSMVSSLRHRGPDDCNIAEFDNAVMGSARLAVVDIDGGRQPIHNQDRSTAVVCNGEIYGHDRIREALRDYPFQTRSDTEVVLALYDRHGTELLDHLPGTFALALWDDRRQRLILARDRFGERPLYYAPTSNGMLAFASDSRALITSGLVDPRPDPEMVAQMLRQGYVPSGRSVWVGVNSLAHASRLDFRPGSEPLTTRWWTPPPVGWDPSEAEATEWFRTELERAVQEQLQADVPVGAFLSGGVDSTTIAALAARRTGGIHAFTFDMPDNSEVGYARQTAELHGMTLHVCRPEPSRIAEQLVDLAELWDEPFGDSSALPTSILSRFAREHVKVVLTGDGADELLGGYLVWARDCLDGDDADPVLTGTTPDRAPTLVDRLRSRFGRRPIQTSHAAYGSPVARRYAYFRQYFEAPDLAALGLPAVDATGVDLGEYRYGTADDISRFDLDHYLPGDILVKTDRASMKYGLEVRSPFLDVAVAEGCLSLPSHHKVDDVEEKLLLRRAFSDLWPEQVRSRRKQGFGSPMEDWLAIPAVEELKNSHLRDRSSALFDLIDFDAAQAFTEPNDQRTWNLLMLSIWWTRSRKEVKRP